MFRHFWALPEALGALANALAEFINVALQVALLTRRLGYFNKLLMAFLFKLFSRFPLWLLHGLGAAMGWLVWPAFKAKAAASTLSLTPTSGRAEPRATSSVDLTGAPTALAAEITSSSLAFKRPNKIFSLTEPLNKNGSCKTMPICLRRDC